MEIEVNDKQELAETGTTAMSMIERMVRDPSIDPLKLEQLMLLQERWAERDAKLAFSVSLSKCQSEIGRVGTDKVNGQTRSSYATYAAIDRIIRPIYTANDFSLSFDSRKSDLEGHICIVCNVAHSKGHTKEYILDIPADGKGAKGGDVMTKTHATGSGISYAMRYLVKMIFNIAFGDDPDDDDGNSAGNQNPKNDKPKPPSMSQDHLATLVALCEEAKLAQATICKAYKMSALEEFPDAMYEELVTRLQNHMKNAAAGKK